MGFSPSFRQWILLFYTDVESAIIVNDWMSPLSTFSQCLSGLSAVPAIICSLCWGSSLQFVGFLWNCWCPTAQFHTGTAGLWIYRQHHSRCHHWRIASRHLYGVPTVQVRPGAKLNCSKSKGLWLGAWEHRSDSLASVDWVQHLPMLGAILSVSDYTKEMWEPHVEKVENRLASWRGCSLSYQMRALVINALALLQIWHLCHFCYARLGCRLTG